MKHRKRLRLLFLLVPLLPIFFVIAYAISALLLAMIPVNTGFKPTPNDSISIFLSSNGIHTDIVLPLENALWDWTDYIDTSLTEYDCADTRYVAFGWGDSALYTTVPKFEDLKFSTAFQAAFGSKSSIMHTEFYTYWSESCETRICLDTFQYLQLATFIHNSFRMNPDGRYQYIQVPSHNGHDIFFRSKWHYGFLYTSNTWINDCLKSFGGKAALWTPLAQGITYYYPEENCDEETSF
jgi:uncharacterized protein (TIGR02117 family)